MTEIGDGSNLNRRERRTLSRGGKNSLNTAANNVIIAQTNLQTVFLRSFDDLSEENGDVGFLFPGIGIASTSIKKP